MSTVLDKKLVDINRRVKEGFNKCTSFRDNSCFNITYKGNTFSALPFLLLATGWNTTEFKQALYGGVSKYIESYKWCDIFKVGETTDNYDVNVDNFLLHSPLVFDMSDIALFLLYKDFKMFIKFIYNGVSFILQEIVLDGNCPELRYKDESIANTQAFSYYLSVVWLCELVPTLKILIGKQTLQKRLYEPLERFMPEGSHLYNYVTGKMTSKEAYHQYITPDREDGTCPKDRELLSYMLDGNFDGSSITEREKVLLNGINTVIISERKMKLNMHMGYCLLHSEYLRNKEITIEDLDLKLADFRELSASYKHKIDHLREELKELRASNKSLSKETSSLRSELSKHEASDVLEGRISDLKKDLASSNDLVTTLLVEQADLKKQIKSLKKELRTASAQLDTYKDAMPECEVDSVEDEISLEEAISFIKDVRIVLVGAGMPSGTIEKLDKYGVHNVKMFNPRVKSIGKCDVLVLCTRQLGHTDAWRAKSLARGADVTYFNGTSIESLIYCIYEGLSN